ncbi:MAG: MoxR family ATPase [Acidobacteria bacterium]|nr:MoxR family ATPase [Acidobacteriota bacterium]
MTIDEVQSLLAAQGYIAGRGLATAVFLSLRLGRPLLLEGEAGVGKTEVAKALAAALGTELIRLQCYEGLDIAHAVYEWNYPRQLLEIRLMEAAGSVDRSSAAAELFRREFLTARPLLRALEHTGPPPVLLIDELDRADEEFEGFLLEMLSDFQITIPELGTVRTATPPIVVLTSNRTRELHDALKRRCLFHWIDYPDFQTELAIVRARRPGAMERLAEQAARFVQELRRAELYKRPGISETLDWIAALEALGAAELDVETVQTTIGMLVKNQEDVAVMDAARTQAMLNAAGQPGARQAG